MLLCAVVETAVIFSKSLITAHHSRDILRDTQTWYVEGKRVCFNNKPSPNLPVAQSHLNPPKSHAKHLTLAYHVANGAPTAYKKTCPSRSKERHSCQLTSDLH